ncbi:MAG TPA: hypothetical protein PKD16_17895, partial [Saprospiraceae bacterium]|nr:hypothetical protein [Saprospiraceae bacterium]
QQISNLWVTGSNPVGITFHNAKQAQIISDFLFGVCFSRSYENNLLKITQINSNYMCPHRHQMIKLTTI